MRRRPRNLGVLFGLRFKARIQGLLLLASGLDALAPWGHFGVFIIPMAGSSGIFFLLARSRILGFIAMLNNCHLLSLLEYP